jgi:hypothetical protein
VLESYEQELTVVGNQFEQVAGLPDCLGKRYQNGGNVPNDHKIYQPTIKYS